MALSLSLGGATLVGISASFAGAQSVAEAARETRKEKKAHAKVVTNDTLPPQETISVVGQPAPASDSAESASDNNASDQAANKDQNKDAKTSNKKTDEDKSDAAKFQEEMDGWKKRLAAQKDSISLLERELDVVQREYRLRAAAFYADAGNRLRSQADWDKMDRDYKDKIDSKQKQVDDAKQKLSDLKDEARKARMPNSVSE